jgi:hypothetical protein
MKKQSVLDHDYLDCRCMLLEIAATLDRYDRSPGETGNPQGVDLRLIRLRKSIEILANSSLKPDRAERMLLMLSEPVL